MSSTTRWGKSIDSADQLPVDRGRTGEVVFLGQQLCLKRLRSGSQRCATLPDLLRTDEPELRILGRPLGIVDILIARHPAVDGLPQQVNQEKPCVLPPAEVCQVLR